MSKNGKRGDGFVRSEHRPGLPRRAIYRARRVSQELLQAAWWRLRREWESHAINLVARVHRRRLGGVTFVGITGSAGKTTAKDLTAAVLATVGRTQRTSHSANNLFDVSRTILRTRPWHRFSVVEISAIGSGSLDKPVALVGPRVAIVTTVGDDHRSAFRNLDATAAEKGKLVAALPVDGIAVLNADDSRVLSMQERCRGRVLTFGLAEKADVRADNVRAAWPGRLAFDLHYRGQIVPVQTRLCGKHWVPSVLAALAAGLALDVPLEAMVKAVVGVEPFRGRMQPVEMNDGVTFIRDDFKGSAWTVPPALDFLAEARASRKIVVFGSISDTSGTHVIRQIARRALKVADLVYFVGPLASVALKAVGGAGDRRLRAFATARAASRQLGEELRSGDLVLVKATNKADHLARLVLARKQRVECWRSRCGKVAFCDTCSLITVPSDTNQPDALVEPSDPREAADSAPAERQIVVGLGNPDARFTDTPHNIGHRVLDLVAARLGESWGAEEGALVARGSWRGVEVELVKPLAPMNLAGSALWTRARQVGFRPTDCVLVFDDMDLPLGTVRVRARGSAGGHRGVRSILEAFQTDEFRRVKVGVRRGDKGRIAADDVLTPFAESERQAVEAACVAAGDAVLELLASACQHRL